MVAEIGKKYKHYKNGKEYTVLHIGRVESNPEIECIIYRAEYDSLDYGSGSIWIRTREVFEEMIEYDGKMVQRFTVIDI